jgi:hypothetical protein
MTGDILTDRTTYNRLRQQYTFEPPTVISVKGKGEMSIYRLTGKVKNASHHFVSS